MYAENTKFAEYYELTLALKLGDILQYDMQTFCICICILYTPIWYADVLYMYMYIVYSNMICRRSVYVYVYYILQYDMQTFCICIYILYTPIWYADVLYMYMYIIYSRIGRREYEKRWIRQNWSILLLLWQCFLILIIRPSASISAPE